MTLYPSFRLNLDSKIPAELVVLGRFTGDADNQNIAFGTVTGKVFIFNPQGSVGESTDSEPQKQCLNINREIIFLDKCASEDHTRDYLVIGTTTTIRIYDAYDNRDICYIDVEDGVRSFTVASLIDDSPEIKHLIVGTTGSVYIYDFEGNEIGWIVVGVPVSYVGVTGGFDTVPVLDIRANLSSESLTSSKHGQLLVASEDKTFVVYKATYEDENFTFKVEHRMTLQSHVIDCQPIYGTDHLLVGLNNNTVQLVTFSGEAVWVRRSLSGIRRVLVTDIMGEQYLMAVIRVTGDIELVYPKDGEVLLTIETGAISGAMNAQFNGKNALVVVQNSGTLMGYYSNEQNLELLSPDIVVYFDSSSLGETRRIAANIAQVADLEQTRNDLEARLRTLENNIRVAKVERGLDVPIDTVITLDVIFNDETNELGIEIICNYEHVSISDVVIFSKKLFPNMSHLVTFQEKKNIVFVPIKKVPAERIALSLDVYLQGSSSPDACRVLRTATELSELSFLRPISITSSSRKSESFMSFSVSERFTRIVVQIREFFCVQNLPFTSNISSEAKNFMQLSAAGNALHKSGISSVEMAFLNMNEDMEIIYLQIIDLEREPNSVASSGTQIIIHTESMSFAFDFVQLIREFCPIIENTLLNFPLRVEKSSELAYEIARLNQSKIAHSAEIQDKLAEVKMAFLGMENSKIISSYSKMSEQVTLLKGSSEALFHDHNHRLKQHEQLVSTLRELNGIIFEFANLLPEDEKQQFVRLSHKLFASNKVLKIPKLLGSLCEE
ncbi:hypothetical protein PCE1_003483 [Barthelona sp. PCE]